ncbi:MAG: VWA domain-containing protein [Polyangiaceae bacterium]|nr:VWA domain-containing protein [Polyangiaceae bacterium]
MIDCQRHSITRSPLVLSGVLLSLALGGCSKESTTGQGAAGNANAAGGAIIAGSGGNGANGALTGGSSGFFPGIGAAGAAGQAGMSGLGECGGVISKASLRAANLLLVIDLSKSMDTQFGTAGVSRWSAVTTSLGTALSSVKERANFGLDLFPSGGECTLPNTADLAVAVAPGKDSVALIQTALTMATPAGGTPTAGALRRALQYFATGAGKDLSGDKFVVLATDGGPNCNGDAPQCEATACTATYDLPQQCGNMNCCMGVVTGCLDESGTTAAVTALAASGIKTVVVGLPGVAPYSASLNAFAQAGGLPQSGATKYFAIDEMLGVSGLTEAFQNITTQLIKSCRLELQMAPPDPTKVNVIIDGTTIAQSGADGWEFDNTTTPPGIVVKGATCQQIEQTGAEKVTVQFGCPTMVIR